MASGIYAIFSPSNKVYVGQSIDLDRRVKEYNKVTCKSQTKLYHSIQKHGWPSHTFDVVMPLKEGLSQMVMTYWEQFFIDYYRNSGFVLMNIREAGPRGKASEETKRKQSQSMTGKKRKPCSEAMKQHLSVLFTGKKQTKEIQDKKRASMLNRGVINITNRTLSDSDVIEIRRLISNKGVGRAIARKYNVTPSVISNIKHNTKWRHVK